MKTPKVKKQTAVKRAGKKNNSVKKNNIEQQTQPVVGKTCGRCCAGCDEDMTERFIQEVSEEVKNDNLKALWDKYGLFIVLFVVVAVSAAVGFETIKSWYNQKYQEQTSVYLSALQPVEDYEKSIRALEKIAAADQGVYSDLARVQIAGILYEQNKKNEAVAMLQSIAKNNNVHKRIQTLAALKLATYQIDTAPTTELKSLLQPIAEQNNAWAPLAKEFLAMTALRDGDVAQAREIYTSLLESKNVSDNFKSRIQDMLSALNDM